MNGSARPRCGTYRSVRTAGIGRMISVASWCTSRTVWWTRMLVAKAFQTSCRKKNWGSSQSFLSAARQTSASSTQTPPRCRHTFFCAPQSKPIGLRANSSASALSESSHPGCFRVWAIPAKTSRRVASICREFVSCIPLPRQTVV